MTSRSLIWITGSVASVVAILGRLSGVFRGWDLALFRWLGQTGLTGSLPLWLELTCVVLFAFGITFIEWGVTSPRVRIGLLLAALLQPISAVAVGALMGIAVSPFAWLTALLVPVLAAGIYRVVERRRREQAFRETFGGNVSALTLEKLASNPEIAQPGTAPGTVLNAWLLGKATGELDRVVERFRETGAWVELQSGDRVVAVWNVPLPTASAAEIAATAALELTENWNVGVASGNITSEFSPAHLWQMRGPVFEKAAALCQANASFGSRALLDLATADAVGDTLILRPVDLFQEPGADVGREVFEPFALARSATPSILAERDQFWNAVILFRQRRFSEALSAFEKAGSDPVVKRYLERLAKNSFAP